MFQKNIHAVKQVVIEDTPQQNFINLFQIVSVFEF
jgi:hypothetical protein